jgi:hypothetical protein
MVVKAIWRTSFMVANFVNMAVSGTLFNYFPDSSWNELFPNRPPDFYSFDSFVAAAERFPDFLTVGDSAIRKKELAAFLANISFETGWIEGHGGFSKWGLHYIEENIPEEHKKNYSDVSSTEYAPVHGKTYQGRGPIQLSWNYNYGLFSEAWFGNKQKLLINPDIVANDSLVAFASAIWFWMTPQYTKPSCHDIMVGNWKPTEEDLCKGRFPGFGSTINVINGGLECGHEKDLARTVYRSRWFEFFCNHFQIPAGEHIGCSGQRPFGT